MDSRARETPYRAFATTVDNIVWEQTNPDGTRSATLVGTRHAGVTFTYAFFIPSGVWDQPHAHTVDAHLVVARGELRLGYGDQLARDAATSYPAGSFLLVPAGAVHFDGAGQDTVILGTAVGPWSTTYVNANVVRPRDRRTAVGHSLDAGPTHRGLEAEIRSP